jgi:hypothetical protein
MISPIINILADTPGYAISLNKNNFTRPGGSADLGLAA